MINWFLNWWGKYRIVEQPKEYRFLYKAQKKISQLEHTVGKSGYLVKKNIKVWETIGEYHDYTGAFIQICNLRDKKKTEKQLKNRKTKIVGWFR